jgi:hypothetical protein
MCSIFSKTYAKIDPLMVLSFEGNRSFDLRRFIEFKAMATLESSIIIFYSDMERYGKWQAEQSGGAIYEQGKRTAFGDVPGCEAGEPGDVQPPQT